LGLVYFGVLFRPERSVASLFEFYNVGSVICFGLYNIYGFGGKQLVVPVLCNRACLIRNGQLSFERKCDGVLCVCVHEQLDRNNATVVFSFKFYFPFCAPVSF